MIRFIDLRGQGTCYRFAFWDTITNRFLSFFGEQAWDVWDGDCAEAITNDLTPADATEALARLRGLCPQWAFEADKDHTHEDRFWVDDCTRRSPHAGPCNGWPCAWRAEQLDAEARLTRGNGCAHHGRDVGVACDVCGKVRAI